MRRWPVILAGVLLAGGWSGSLLAGPPRTLALQPRAAERDSFVDRNRNGVNDLLEEKGKHFLDLIKRKLERSQKDKTRRSTKARPPR